MHVMSLPPEKGADYYVHYIDYNRGIITVKYREGSVAIVGKHLEISMDYKYPAKNDAESVRELDAHSWTEEMEARP